MDHKIKLFFFGLLVLKAIVSIQAAETSFEHDVTKQIDGWIAKILKVNSGTVKKVFSRITQKLIQEYVHDIGHEISPFGDKFLIRNVYMNVSEFKSAQINWKFSENKMGVFIKEFTVRIMGTLLETSTSVFGKFDTHLDLENVTFTLSINEAEKPSWEFTEENAWLWYNDNDDIDWSKYDNRRDEPEGLTKFKKIELSKAMMPVLKKLLRENLKTNEEFSKTLRTLFKAYSGSKKALLSTHSDFFTDDNKYYYLIPKISFFCFNLKNIFIRGLWHLEWLKVNTGLSIFTHTLMIRNVQGSLILDFGTTQEKPVELQFKIDYFSISIDGKSVNVDARCYSVNKTDTPLSYRQSALIMQRIELAVANSVLPAMENRRTFDIDTPLEQIKITKETDWKQIKTSFREWIPFNDDEVKHSPYSGIKT